MYTGAPSENTLQIKSPPPPTHRTETIIQELSLFWSKNTNCGLPRGHIKFTPLCMTVKLNHTSTDSTVYPRCWCSQVFRGMVNEWVRIGGLVKTPVAASDGSWRFEWLSDRFQWLFPYNFFPLSHMLSHAIPNLPKIT